MRIYAYVDGESHYERSLDLWKRLHGQDADLSQIEVSNHSGGTTFFPDMNRPNILIEPRSKFFWDVLYPSIAPYPFAGHSLDGAVYFTAFSGDEDDHHQACVAMRKQRFDPRIIRERKQLADHRKNRAASDGLLEKAKGVDIGLSVRILEDAYHNIFDVCYFFTSDIDFLPVIRVIQRLGKKAVVFGYADGIGKRSELEYVPDAFIDLGERMRTAYRYAGPSTD